MSHDPACTKSKTWRIFDVKKARIIPTKNVHADIPLQGYGCKPAMQGTPYRIAMNPLGAVSAVVEDLKGGTQLGMKPSEFTWLGPYGEVGDLLWVRETWANWEGDTAFKAGKVIVNDWRTFDNPDHDDITQLKLWKHDIHLPMLSSRILLQITDLKVERLEDMDDADAIAEGMPEACCNLKDTITGPQNVHPKVQFMEVWDRINGKTPNANWNSNPQVWVITFKRLN
jgi:hypothetical protein